MLDEARSHFRWVVIDSPPTLPFTDATIIASKVDGVLAVVRAGVTSRDVLKMFANILARVNAPMLGLVLNGVIDESRRSMRYANETLVQKAVKHAS
jgi:Mrp family chromosome partitioning ATPase